MRVSVTCLRWHSQRDQLEQGLLTPMPCPSAPCLAAAHRSSHVTATAISDRTQRSTYQVPTLLTEPLEAQRGQVKQRKEQNSNQRPWPVMTIMNHQGAHGLLYTAVGRTCLGVCLSVLALNLQGFVCLVGWLVWVGLVFLLSSVSRNIIQWSLSSRRSLSVVCTQIYAGQALCL